LSQCFDRLLKTNGRHRAIHEVGGTAQLQVDAVCRAISENIKFSMLNRRIFTQMYKFVFKL